MRNVFKYKIFLLLITLVLILIPTTASLAGNLEIGAPCTDDSDCKFDDCQKSDVPINKNQYFCVCEDDSDCDVYGDKKDNGKWDCRWWKSSDDKNLGHELNVCQHNDTGKIIYPFDSSGTPTKAFGGVATNVGSVALLNEIKTFKPSNMIKIPNLTFTDVENTIDSEGYIHLPWIGELLKAVYNWGMVVASIVAAIMIILTATKIIMGGGGATAEGYKKIGTIVVGLFIAWGSYAILYNINPALVEFKALRIKYIEPEELPEGDASDDNGTNQDDGANSNVVAASNPVSGNFKGQTHKGETMVGACHMIPIESFPDFDINTFGDGYNGRCLLQEFIPVVKDYRKYQKTASFLGKKITMNEKVIPIMKKIESELISKAATSPIVKYWIDYFTTEGGFVPSNPTEIKNSKGVVTRNTLLDECKKPGKEETWVVTDAGYKHKFRLLSNILKDLHGQKKVIMADMHSMGLAIDIYAIENWNDKPLYTQMPAEVVKIFYDNGFSWLGSTAGRDAMHFQYFKNKCFKSLGNMYPSGNGCCINPWKLKAKSKTPSKANSPVGIPLYSVCSTEKPPVSYLSCLGEKGTPGNMWVREPQNDESTTKYVTQ